MGIVPVFIACIAMPAIAFAALKNVAIIDREAESPLTEAQQWCELLIAHGHSCTVFPKEGPTAPLDPFDVVIDMSYLWTDPTGMLADLMRQGKTVIVWFSAPLALGIDTNPTVQAWIGANAFVSPWDRLYTIARDPILGNIPVGTQLDNCADGPCSGLTDTTGHPNAKVLARFLDLPWAPIGIMRNVWEGGVSVYLANLIDPSHPQIILNAVQAENPIPILNFWGLLVLALGMAAGGTIVLRRQADREPGEWNAWVPMLLIGALCPLRSRDQLAARWLTSSPVPTRRRSARTPRIEPPAWTALP
jgi:hypothetical protein